MALLKSFINTEVILVEDISQVPKDTIYLYRIEKCHGELMNRTDEEIAKEFLGKYIRIPK